MQFVSSVTLHDKTEGQKQKSPHSERSQNTSKNFAFPLLYSDHTSL